jgi:hypothetical protein
VDVDPELASQITNERPKARANSGLPEEVSKLTVRGVEQVLSDVFEEVELTGKDGNRYLEFSDKSIDGPYDAATQIAHDGTRSSEALYGFT